MGLLGNPMIFNSCAIALFKNSYTYSNQKTEECTDIVCDNVYLAMTYLQKFEIYQEK